jgi:hypothetical protein
MFYCVDCEKAMKLKLYNFYHNNEKLYLLKLVQDGTMNSADVGEKVGKLLNTRFPMKCATHKEHLGLRLGLFVYPFNPKNLN